MRLVIIAIVTLLVGGAVVGTVLYQQAQPDGVPKGASGRELAMFLADEHMAAARDGAPANFAVTDPEELPDQSSVWLGQQLHLGETLFAEEHGLRFIGARRSQVPGANPQSSGHMLFTTQGGHWASVFLNKYVEPPVLQMRTAYSLAAPKLGPGAPPVVVWRPGGLVYYLVSESPEGVAALRQALGIPEPQQQLR